MNQEIAKTGQEQLEREIDATISARLSKHGLTKEQAKSEFENVVAELVHRALKEVGKRYGLDGEGSKPFHDLAHTLEFIDDGMELLKSSIEARIIPRQDTIDLERLKWQIALGACYHDLEQNLGPGKNEEASRDQLNLDMVKTGYNFDDEDKYLAFAGIEATKVINYVGLEQNVTEQQNTLARFVQCLFADADLSAFLRYDRQHWRGNRLFWELRKSSGPLKQYEVINWLDGQVKTLETHSRHWRLKNSLKDHPPYSLGEDQKNIHLYQTLLNKIRSGQGIASEYLNRVMSIRKEHTDQIKAELGLAT